MKMNKKNKNGFTLVELVVVVCIFGIILSAILNFIKPANEIHDDTQATMDANVISSGLIEYLDDELRYATNVLVLKDFYGVPEVSTDGKVGTKPETYTNCIMIDNCNPRGYTDKNYNPDADDTATKMRARGSIIKISKLDTEGFNFNNSQIAKGASFYDKFTFIISAGSNVLDEEKFKADKTVTTLQINMQAFSPVYQNGEFVFTKRKFDRDTQTGEGGTIEKEKGAVLNLTNINISTEDKNELKAYEVPDLNPTQAINKAADDGYPAATSVPADATSYQAEIYNALRTINYADTNGEKKDVHPRYTYIFYQKKKSANKCTVSFKNASDSPFSPGAEVASPYTDVVKGTLFKSFPAIPSAPSGYNPGVWIAPDGSTVDTSAGYTIDGDTVFLLQYTEKAPSPNEVTIHWLYPDGTEFCKTKQDKAIGGEFVSINVPAGDPVDTTEFDYKWVQQGTGAAVETVNLTGEMTFIPNTTKKPTVSFSTDGTNVDSQVRGSKGEVLPSHFIPEADAAKIPSGKMFDKWVLKGDASKDVESTPISEDCTFVAQFKDKPPVPSDASVVKVHVKKLSGGSNKIAVAPEGGGQLDYQISGDFTASRDKTWWKEFDDKLHVGDTYEFTFYNKAGSGTASTMKLQFQWGTARMFTFNGTLTEVWYKDGQFYDSDPG